MVMMGHHRPEYRAWIEAAGYAKAKDLCTYELDIRIGKIPVIDRLIATGERNPRIRIRKVDKSRFDEEAATDPRPLERRLVGQLGLRPADRGRDRLCRQEAEADHLRGPGADRRSRWRAGRVHDDHPRHQRVDQDLNGELFPFGCVKLLWRLRKPRTRRLRVPLMGVAKKLHDTPPRQPAGLHDDRVHPPRRGRQVSAPPTASSAGSSRTIRG